MGLALLLAGLLVGPARPGFAQLAPEMPGSITAYCGGGVTGGGGGTRITSDGELVRLDRARSGAPQTLTLLGNDIQAYRRWKTTLDEAGFTRMTDLRPGNLSCSLTQEVRGRLFGLAWPGAAPPSRIPEPVRRVFLELRARGD
ncbi:hypothetical protein HEQ75_07735 [Roseomonas sp. BU-1]|uniref:Uncharacterized protein n=2 Tax=Falsiroseomonas selenitidurans TaxID=2716335 RepID=A0ABX1E217_9PROT|nr:hypothetical protein [Falsiroseomonas selenitidurans]